MAAIEHTADKPLINVRGLSKSYRKHFFSALQYALLDLSVAFPYKQLTALLGANGAGKTTLIRTLLGLIYSDRGEIQFAGEKLCQEHRRFFGYIPETNHLPKQLSCLEALALQERLYGRRSSPARLAEALEQVGLAGEGEKRIADLSKGMGRRLAWALATIHQPEVLILDEPYSGLDPSGRQAMASWLEAEHQLGKTMILCTHDLEKLPSFTQKILILKKGQCIFTHEHGPLPRPEELLCYFEALPHGPSRPSF